MLLPRQRWFGFFLNKELRIIYKLFSLDRLYSQSGLNQGSVITNNSETLTDTFRCQPGFLTIYPDKVYNHPGQAGISHVHNPSFR